MDVKGRTLPAWTLAEVLLAMAIVFLMSGTVGIVGRTQIERARHLAARQQIAAVRVALETYAVDTGDYPTQEQGLRALVELPVLSPVPEGWHGPYLVGTVPTDPWGDPYAYTRSAGTAAYRLTYSREEAE